MRIIIHWNKTFPAFARSGARRIYRMIGCGLKIVRTIAKCIVLSYIRIKVFIRQERRHNKIRWLEMLTEPFEI
jgi:hypothetical protein